MMTLEAALLHQGLRVAAWDRYSKNATTLRIVAMDGPRLDVVVRETVPTDQRSELDRRLRAHGVLIGATYRVCKFVWVFGQETLGVWEIGGGRLLESNKLEIARLSQQQEGCPIRRKKEERRVRLQPPPIAEGKGEDRPLLQSRHQGLVHCFAT